VAVKTPRQASLPSTQEVACRQVSGIKQSKKAIKKGMKSETRLAHISPCHTVVVVLFFLY
jgi:hypothetical protein